MGKAKNGLFCYSYEFDTEYMFNVRKNVKRLLQKCILHFYVGIDIMINTLCGCYGVVQMQKR